MAALLELAPAVRTRVLRLAALRAGARDAELFHEHVRALDALLTDWHGQGAVDLPGRVRGVRRDGTLVFERAESRPVAGCAAWTSATSSRTS